MGCKDNNIAGAGVGYVVPMSEGKCNMMRALLLLLLL
jgi:hypothetical protein